MASIEIAKADASAAANYQAQVTFTSSAEVVFEALTTVPGLTARREARALRNLTR
jgi:hypothetical protein